MSDAYRMQSTFKTQLINEFNSSVDNRISKLSNISNKDLYDNILLEIYTIKSLIEDDDIKVYIHKMSRDNTPRHFSRKTNAGVYNVYAKITELKSFLRIFKYKTYRKEHLFSFGIDFSIIKNKYVFIVNCDNYDGQITLWPTTIEEFREAMIDFIKSDSFYKVANRLGITL